MPSKSALRQQWNEAGKDVVVLHQFPRARSCPSPSPYPLKLETYLRIADIKYVSDYEQPMSGKGKSPWITFNGEDLADSQLCVEHLACKLEKNLSKNLTREEKAVARGIRAILEDHFHFCLAMERWAYSDVTYFRDKVLAPLPIPGFLSGFFMRRIAKGVIKQATDQGIGRHTQQEVRRIGLQDLKAVSDYLGTKTYVMGESPTEVDCVVFGFIVVLLYCFPEDNVYRKALENGMVNLKEHCQRMKKKFWPDWKECCYKKE